jgi:D-alanyl-D-alanine carboxypeptidase (penicillin-binding protein 5/6)
MKTILNALVVTLVLSTLTTRAETPRKTAAKAAPKASAVVKPPARPTSVRGVPVISRDPYLGLIAVDGATGKVLVEDNADATVYPASVIKVMTLFVVMDRIQQGSARLTDPITASAEATRLGGSQVYLKEGEVFTVEELIYALMVQSANDAAAALAIHVAGSQTAFVELMNQKAQALGMTNTHFYSCHGLPPTPPRKAEEIDSSTSRDLALLGRALVNAYPDVIRYSSTKERTFRTTPKPFVMRNHNHRLMASFPGVDGLKTGYILAGGYSAIVTAMRNDRRVFVVVCGSVATFGKTRDKAAAEALNRAFAALPPAPPPPPPPPAATNLTASSEQPDATRIIPESAAGKSVSSTWRTASLVLGIVVLGGIVMTGVFAWRRRQSDSSLIDHDSNTPHRPFPPLHR